MRRWTVIAPNFKKRLSGVTSTIIQLVPAQHASGLDIAVIGPGLPPHLPRMNYRDVWKLWRLPADGKPRVWHARRNLEMLAGIFLRDVLRMPLKLLFTSAAQRHHKRYTRWLIAKMDAVIATSQTSGSYLTVSHSVVHHGIDCARFIEPDNKSEAKRALGLDPDRRIVGCTGRIRPSKGTDLAVDAMIRCAKASPNWDMIIAGRATAEYAAFKQGLLEKITDAGLQDRIRFVGEVDDILPWYQAFDLFLAPSREEGFGLTPLEAMACGVPCLASTAGHYRGMIDENRTGNIVEYDTSDAWTMALQKLLNDNALLQKYSSASRQRVQIEFSLDQELSGIGKVYARLRG